MRPGATIAGERLMTNTVTLSANNGSQVQSAGVVKVLTAEPNVWLYIYSGLAQQAQWATGDSYWIFGEDSAETDATVNITLDKVAGVLLEYAATASLANIAEESDFGGWIVNSDSLSLHNDGELVLTLNTSVIGGGDGGSGFWGVSYYVAAKVLVDTPSISGTIRWDKTLATPLAAPHFTVTADIQVPGSPGQFPTLQVVATGAEGAVDAADPTYYYVPYTISGLVLLGTTVSVVVDVIAASFGGVGNGFLAPEQISGPTSITLTTADLHVTNVDFQLNFEENPQ